MKLTKSKLKEIIKEVNSEFINEASVYKQSDARGVKKALDKLISPLFLQIRFAKAHKNSELDSVIEDVLDEFKSKLRVNTGIKL